MPSIQGTRKPMVEATCREKAETPPNAPDFVTDPKAGSDRQARCWRPGEEGQGLLETAVGLLFLLLILLVMFEMLFVFTSYIALLNASSQGAMRAAGHPNMEVGDYHYEQYVSDIQGEVIASGLSWNDTHINPPELPADVESGNPITVTLDGEC